MSSRLLIQDVRYAAIEPLHHAVDHDVRSNPAASGEEIWRYATAPNPNCCKNGSIFSAARCPSAMASSAR